MLTQMQDQLQLRTAMDNALEAGRRVISQGQVASYIPELGKEDPLRLGAAAAFPNEAVLTCGEVADSFSLQSIGKVISLSLALQKLGPEVVFARVGMEPTDEPFNSLGNLETAAPSRPLNPLINSGAIAVCGLLVEAFGSVGAFEAILSFAEAISGPEALTMDERVYHSELQTGHRNWAFAYLLRDLDMLRCDPIEALELYLKICALETNCSGLAHMACRYAVAGVNGHLGEKWSETVRIVNGLLVTCGMYNASGEFAVRVGLPAKSGVSGGIMVVVPRQMGLAVIGPALDEHGNSIGGIEFLAHLSQGLNLHMF